MGWGLDPKGGMDVQPALDLVTGMWSGSFISGDFKYPFYNVKLDGNYFLEDLLGSNHEFKFGIEYRLMTAKFNFSWPGDVTKYYWNGAPMFAEVRREELLK